MLKKTALCLCAILCVSLAGCSESSSSNASTDSASSDPHAYDTLSKTFLPIFQGYYDGLKSGDYDACFSSFPEFYTKRQESDLDGQEQEYMDAAKQWFVESYGEDFTIELSLGNIFQLTDESLQDFEEILTDTFSEPVELDTAYSVVVREYGKGSLGSNTIETEWYVLQIDGKNYMYDTFYESTEDASEPTDATTAS